MPACLDAARHACALNFVVEVASIGLMGLLRPHLPRSRSAREQSVELEPVLRRVHAAPEAVVGHGEKLPLFDQTTKRLDDELLAFLHVLEDLAPKREEA